MSNVTTTQQVQLIGKSELSGKSILQVIQAKWMGATVVFTTDNCVSVTYSTYDGLLERFDHHEITSMDVYKRVIEKDLPQYLRKTTLN